MSTGGRDSDPFTPNEVAYLSGLRLGRLATLGPNGQPHVVPVGYRFNAETNTLDLYGYLLTFSKKWRDVRGNSRVAFVVDDWGEPREPRGVEVRGRAEQVATDGSPEEGRDGFIRIHPTRIVSWGIDTDALHPNSRKVVRSGTGD